MGQRLNLPSAFLTIVAVADNASNGYANGLYGHLPTGTACLNPQR